MRVRRLLFGILIASVAAGLAFVLANARFFEGLFGAAEYRLVDWRMRGAAEPPREKSDVVLVLFDSSSVRDWPYLVPFPRPVLADLVDAVSSTGARAIGLDVYLERRAQAIDRAMHVPGDSLLETAMARAGNVVLAAPTVQRDGKRLFRPPDPYFLRAAQAVGSADTPSPFEVFRDIELTVRTDRGLVPGFALALFAAARGLDLDSLMQATQHKGFLDIPGLPMRYAKLPPPGVAVQTMPILYVGPPSSPDREDGGFVALPAGLVQATWDQPEPMRAIGMNALAGQLRSRVVMLGSGFHAEERYRTPFYDATNAKGDIYGWMYGTEVVATALHDLLTGRIIVPLTHVQAALLLLLVAGLITLAVFWRGVTFGALAGGAVVVVELAGAWLAFGLLRVHVPMVGPSLAAFFAFVGATSYTSIVEGRQGRMIRGAFSKYLSPVLVDELVADPSRLKLGGEKREISVLFTDLAGFTSLSETMDPEELLTLLNRYLDEMADIVLLEGGTLDKYIGDAIMALYGAPTALPDHALRACRTALRMQRRLKELDRQWADQGLPRLRMRVGINTGAPVVGNIGGEKHFDYTALGDAVNLAARLEPACKAYDVEIMISESTREQAGDGIVVRELDLLAVYGKEEPVRVYELVGLAGEEADGGAQGAELSGHFEQGLGAYRNRDFERAARYFEAAARIAPADGPTMLYLERCREFAVRPPPADWDGVERRRVK